MFLIFYKGKGLFVILYLVVSLIASMILTKCLDEYILGNILPGKAYMISCAAGLFIAGFWTYKTSMDYYKDDEGKKQEIYFGHSFMFIEMKTWAYILWVMGCFTLIGGIMELIID